MLCDSKPAAWQKVSRYDERLARGESIAVIQLQYDYACNMSCEHCSISDFRRATGAASRRGLDPEDIRMLCNQADAYGLAQRLARQYRDASVSVLTYAEAEDLGLIEG